MKHQLLPTIKTTNRHKTNIANLKPTIESLSHPMIQAENTSH